MFSDNVFLFFFLICFPEKIYILTRKCISERKKKKKILCLEEEWQRNCVSLKITRITIKSYLSAKSEKFICAHSYNTILRDGLQALFMTSRNLA